MKLVSDTGQSWKLLRRMGKSLIRRNYQMHQLFDHDEQSKLTFCKKIFQRNSTQNFWSDKIIFSDISTFNMSGKINHPNEFYRESVCLWQGTYQIKAPDHIRRSIIPWHYGSGHKRKDTTTNDRPCHILTKKTFPVLSRRPHHSAVFQQDGAPPTSATTQ